LDPRLQGESRGMLLEYQISTILGVFIDAVHSVCVVAIWHGLIKACNSSRHRLMFSGSLATLRINPISTVQSMGGQVQLLGLRWISKGAEAWANSQ
jgi:hypothetical protein